MFTLNCKGKLISTQVPLIMGIINATPDSFFDGHIKNGIAGMVDLAKKMVIDGADILDIGGQSTRPNSERITINEEIERVIPVIGAIHAALPDSIISIDTYQSEVAKAAVNAGASIVNDISAGEMDSSMVATVANMGNVPYICMHMKGSPETMQQHTNYTEVTKEVLEYFILKTVECKKAGIKDIIIDVGFGFAKDVTQNFTLLKNLSVFEMLDCPILVGISRKSMIYKTLGITAADALNGTTVLNTLALMNGASILRVHDVKEAREAVMLVGKYNTISKK
jgi:dihydropteroate synthase